MARRLVVPQTHPHTARTEQCNRVPAFSTLSARNAMPNMNPKMSHTDGLACVLASCCKNGNNPPANANSPPGQRTRDPASRSKREALVKREDTEGTVSHNEAQFKRTHICTFATTLLTDYLRCLTIRAGAQNPLAPAPVDLSSTIKPVQQAWLFMESTKTTCAYVQVKQGTLAAPARTVATPVRPCSRDMHVRSRCCTQQGTHLLQQVIASSYFCMYLPQRGLRSAPLPTTLFPRPGRQQTSRSMLDPACCSTRGRTRAMWAQRPVRFMLMAAYLERTPAALPGSSAHRTCCVHAIGTSTLTAVRAALSSCRPGTERSA